MSDNLSRRDFIKFIGVSTAAVGLGSQLDGQINEAIGQPKSTITEQGFRSLSGEQKGREDTISRAVLRKKTYKAQGVRPNILYFQVDNLGIGELGCYGGGILRGAATTRIDLFADQSLKLLNFAPEAQCTPSRSALMTGRYSVRSGNQKIPYAGEDAGIVAWERTIGDILSDEGYACACYGKWHIGESDGRYPTDHGFDEWYGPIRTYDECLWGTRAEYDPHRDIKSPVLEGTKGKKVNIDIDILTLDVRRDIDLEYLKRSEAFIRNKVKTGVPFFVYFNHSLMHMPTVPRKEFEGKSGSGDWADCLLELDYDFGKLLDLLDELKISDQTIVIFAGDNGSEETWPWRGTSGYWQGSYFTGMEGSLRSPCLMRWPQQISTKRESNEIVHITDMFTTLINWAGGEIPSDRIIDGIDQSAFFEGDTDGSAREGFIFWNGDRIYGIKWKDFKVSYVEQKHMWDPVINYAVPRINNLKVDPQERENMAVYYGWVADHAAKILNQFYASTLKEPLIPPDSPLDYNPYKTKKNT